MPIDPSSRTAMRIAPRDGIKEVRGTRDSAKILGGLIGRRTVRTRRLKLRLAGEKIASRRFAGVY